MTGHSILLQDPSLQIASPVRHGSESPPHNGKIIRGDCCYKYIREKQVAFKGNSFKDIVSP